VPSCQWRFSRFVYRAAIVSTQTEPALLGPTIEANWGDWIEVTVTNNIENEGTSIHWHGLLQTNSPWMDGVPGNTQCPIAPGSTFTYRFQADLYGTTWYHSHWSAQYGSGLYGPIVIYGPKNCDYDYDLGPITLSDYLHEYYEVAVEKTLANLQTGNPGPPLADNNLINGKASNGPAPMASFNFTSGKTYRLRLINTSAASVQKFTIDGYTMTVFANDFVEIVPYETDVVTLSVGQRSDVLVKATGKSTDAVWMRSYRPPQCGPSSGPDGEEVKAAIFYEDADRSQQPTTEPGPNAYNTYCGNDPLEQTVPVYPIAPGDPSTTEVIPIRFDSNGTTLIWYLADRTFRINYNDPILLEAKLGNFDFPFIENVHNYGTNKSVRFVLENPGNQPHPMHLHGHNIFVLQEGPCAGDGGVQGPPPGGAGGPPTGANSTSNSTTKRAVAEGTKIKRDTPVGNCWDGTIVNPDVCIHRHIPES
jgi:FtsP/CotA-like multicopper oxidase with cupredoxin domain